MSPLRLASQLSVRTRERLTDYSSCLLDVFSRPFVQSNLATYAWSQLSSASRCLHGQVLCVRTSKGFFEFFRSVSVVTCSSACAFTRAAPSSAFTASPPSSLSFASHSGFAVFQRRLYSEASVPFVGIVNTFAVGWPPL